MDDISIIGGGIAGLALAAGLAPGRFRVTVYERRQELPPVETSLAMWPEAQLALGELGILAAARAAGSGFGGMALRDGSGNVLLQAKAPGVIGISRTDLLGLLAAAVPDSVDRIYGPVVSPPRSGLVVGADGVHSIVRRDGWGEGTRARLTPYVALRGIIDAPVPPDAGGEYWGRGQLFGITPAARGRTYWYASYRSELGPAGIDVEAALAATRERFAGRSAAIGRTLAAAAPDSTLAQRIWTVPPLARYARGSAVLVGDAAHGMTPNLGRGACEALIDAVTLAGLLNARPAREAFAAYSRRRLPRSQALRAASSAVTRLALAEGGQPLRDWLLAAAAKSRRAGPAV